MKSLTSYLSPTLRWAVGLGTVSSSLVSLEATGGRPFWGACRPKLVENKRRSVVGASLGRSLILTLDNLVIL